MRIHLFPYSTNAQKEIVHHKNNFQNLLAVAMHRVSKIAAGKFVGAFLFALILGTFATGTQAQAAKKQSEVASWAFQDVKIKNSQNSAEVRGEDEKNAETVEVMDVNEYAKHGVNAKNAKKSRDAKRDAKGKKGAALDPEKTIFLVTTSHAALIPEPSTYALCGGITVLGVAFWRRRRKSRRTR